MGIAIGKIDLSGAEGIAQPGSPQQQHNIMSQ